MDTPHFYSGNFSPGRVILVILGGICCVLLLMTIPVIRPMDEHKIIRANETSAIVSIQKLNAVEAIFHAARPQKGYACSLLDFNWSPEGEPAPLPEQQIDVELEYGQKSGYTFLLNCGPGVRTNNVAYYSSYTIVAVPISFGRTGQRSFCSDQDGKISFDPKGGKNCTETLQ